MRCNHCDPTSNAPTCARCSLLLPKLTSAHEVLKPDEESLAMVRAALSSVDVGSLRAGDESSLLAIWEGLIASAPAIGPVPGLEAATSSVNWGQNEIAGWQEYLEFHTLDELDEHHFELLLPCGSGYERRGNGHYIDGSRLQGPLPSLDISALLSQNNAESIAEKFNDWGELLAALAAACWTGVEPISLGWVQQRIYDSAPPILSEEIRSSFDNAFGNIFAGVGMHPFWHFACSRSESSIDDTLTESETLEAKQWKKLEYTLGSVSRAWRESFELEGVKSRTHSYLPSLIVLDGRLQLLNLSPEGFCSTRIPLDADVWRMVIAWALYPPKSEVGQYLRAIQWLLLQEDESDEIAPLPERRALEFLSTIWSNLGSNVTLTHDGNFAIQGESGLAYRLGVSKSRTEWDLSVRAHRNCADAVAERNGVSVCIQLGDLKPGLPFGDRIGTFLLALRSDLSTANSISTLQDLHNCWFGNHVQNRKRWKMLDESHPNGFVEQDEDFDEDWLEEEWEEGEHECWEDDELILNLPNINAADPNDTPLFHQPPVEIEASPPDDEKVEGEMEVWRMVADALGERMDR